MKIGLIDVDAFHRKRSTFPNIALMKLSAYHKSAGDSVEWYDPLIKSGYDRVYMSKVFGNEYTPDYPFAVNANEVIKAGSGYAISIRDGSECYCKIDDPPLPMHIEHIMPDYGLYGISDTAYGFLTRGCPRGCAFCHVASMQGKRVVTVAELSEFWDGQREIKLLDPNLTASPDCVPLMKQLIKSGAYIDFTQGLDIRMMTSEKIDALNQMRWKRIHFAWDNPEDDLYEKFESVAKQLKRFRRDTVSCYVLTNFNSTHDQDLQRINALRSLGIQPYVMIYRKETASKDTKRLQRWTSPFIFWKCESFEEYQKKEDK